MKLRGALLLLVAATICTLGGLLSPQDAAASVDVVNQWPAKPAIASNSGAGTVSVNYTPGTGTNRLMLVAIATKYSALATPNFTTTPPSFGGVAFTPITTTASSQNGIWFGYMKEASIGTGAKLLSVTNTVTTNLTGTYVSVAVYNGVDQTTPVTGFGYTALTVAAGTVATPTVTMTANAGLAGNTGLAVYVTNWGGAATTSAVTGTGSFLSTFPFTEVRDSAVGTASNVNLAYGYTVTTGAPSGILTSTAASNFGAIAAVGLNPAVRLFQIGVGPSSCGDCHGNPPVDGTARNTPRGQFLGAHSKHSGSDEGQYGQVCTVCHKDNGTNQKHEDGFKNVSGTKVPGKSYGGTTSAIPSVNPPTYAQTCTKSTCHSTGRTTLQYAASPVWTGTTTCLSCHGGRSTAGLNPPARSTSNFSMSTSHSQHLKYLTGEMNCQTCHGKIAKDHTALKDYTGAKYHGNASKNVNFTDIAYGSYTSYKSTASGSSANTKVCSNTSCHGGSSRGGWKENLAGGGINTDHTCAHCHGTAGTLNTTLTTGVDRYNLRYFAPGYKKPGGNIGTSTDQIVNSNNNRVGSHFKHLSSSYMKNIKCNECHKVPSTPFSADTNHTLKTLRFNSGTLDFTQASSARIAIGVASGSTPAQLAAFNGYTSGTAIKAATCSSVYCHGSRLKTADTSGSYKKPYWNYSAMVNYSDKNQACGRCHGNPPTTGDSQAAHNPYIGQPTTSCSGCHSMVVNASGVIINKNLHINGQVDGGGHAWPYPGSTHDSDAGAAGYTACVGCHTNWNAAANTYPFTRSSQAAVTCKTCHKGATFNTAGQGCADCHGTNANGGRPNGGGAVLTAFPNYSGSHTIHVVGQAMTCNDCHFSGGTQTASHGSGGGTLRNNVTFVTLSSPNGKFHATKTTTQATCSSVACHGTAIWGVTKFNCVSCHSVAITRTLGAPGKQLAAASLEFGLAWGHKASGKTPNRGAVTAADCIVCHLEGVGGTTNTSLTYHKNGTIDLRDPDGTGDARITNMSNASYSFVRFSTSYAATSRTSTGHLSNSVDNVITRKFCLKCHDANGATNTTARSGAGTAAMPFGGIALGATYTATNGAIGTQGLVNVFKQFSSGNSSRHPVGAPNSRAYPYSTRLAAPYNNIGTTRNTNTAAGNTATPRTKANSVVMYCNDCHAANRTTTLRTITAHGNAVGLIGTYYVASPTLCMNCHGGTTTANTTTSYADTTGGDHNSGSAFVTGDNNYASSMATCHTCHLSQRTTVPSRPIKAQDIHGFNNMQTTVNGWAYGNANGMRPIAFMRNASQWTSTSPRPYVAPGITAGQSNCGGSATLGCGNEAHDNYSPGGSY